VCAITIFGDNGNKSESRRGVEEWNAGRSRTSQHGRSGADDDRQRLRPRSVGYIWDDVPAGFGMHLLTLLRGVRGTRDVNHL